MQCVILICKGLLLIPDLLELICREVPCLGGLDSNKDPNYQDLVISIYLTIGV